MGSWHPWPRLIGLVSAMLFLGHVTLCIFKDVFGRDAVTRETLYGAVCIYILIGLFWSMIYLFIEIMAPGSFSFNTEELLNFEGLTTRLLYFSYTTLTTTGYGDITPTTDVARSLATLEHGVGVFYIAIMMARLVGMYRPESKVQEDKGHM